MSEKPRPYQNSTTRFSAKEMALLLVLAVLLTDVIWSFLLAPKKLQLKEDTAVLAGQSAAIKKYINVNNFSTKAFKTLPQLIRCT